MKETFRAPPPNFSAISLRQNHFCLWPDFGEFLPKEETWRVDDDVHVLILIFLSDFFDSNFSVEKVNPSTPHKKMHFRSIVDSEAERTECGGKRFCASFVVACHDVLKERVIFRPKMNFKSLFSGCGKIRAHL